MPSEALRIVPEAGAAEPPIDAVLIGEPLAPAMLMAVDDLARELRTPAKTIRRMDVAGCLRSGQISRRKRWTGQTFAGWIAAGYPRQTESRTISQMIEWAEAWSQGRLSTSPVRVRFPVGPIKTPDVAAGRTAKGGYPLETSLAPGYPRGKH